MAVEVHIYPSLCNQLGTEYKIDKEAEFYKIIDLNNNEYGISARLKTIARDNINLEDLLENKSTIALVQQPDTYGWFTVEDADKLQR